MTEETDPGEPEDDLEEDDASVSSDSTNAKKEEDRHKGKVVLSLF